MCPGSDTVRQFVTNQTGSYGTRSGKHGLSVLSNKNFRRIFSLTNFVVDPREGDYQASRRCRQDTEEQTAVTRCSVGKCLTVILQPTSQTFFSFLFALTIVSRDYLRWWRPWLF